MELMKEDALILSGQSHLRAWDAGVIEEYLRRGMNLRDAQALALRLGLMRGESIVKNLIVTAGKGLVGDLLIDDESVGLTYHEIGTGTTAPAAGDTGLDTPAARKGWTTRDRSSSVLTLSVFYAAAECTYAIEEAGVFGGAAASATLGSGVLFSRYLQSYDNSAGAVDLTFDYTLTIG